MKTRVFTVCAIILLFCGVAHADSAKLVNPANGHSYQRFDTTTNWTSAKSACATLGGHLATITSQAENDWIQLNIAVGLLRVWLGGTQEGSWKWITGESFAYTNWGPGEPGEPQSSNCLDMMGQSAGQWNDEGCGSPEQSYLCEWDNIVCTDIAVKPHTFTTGTPAKAADVNADFDTLYQQINIQNCQIQALKAIVCKNEPTASVCQ
jgi:hypothetical protein